VFRRQAISCGNLLFGAEQLKLMMGPELAQALISRIVEKSGLKELRGFVDFTRLAQPFEHLAEDVRIVRGQLSGAA
jgi:hypothetical protein